MGPAHFDALELRRLFAYDLSIAALNLDTPTVTRGDTVSGSVVVTNVGDTASPMGSIYFALTQNDANADNDGPVGVVGRVEQLPLAPIAPGDTVTVALSLLTPAALPTGSFFFSAVATERQGPIADPNADVDFQLGDANGDNNQLSAASKVTVNAQSPAVGRGDSSFGTDGSTSSVIPQAIRIDASVYDSSTGNTFAVVTGMKDNVPKVGVLRILSDGSVDQTFGSGPGGVQGFPQAPDAQATGITKLDDGTFLVTAMTPEQDIVLIRLGPDGQAIAAFGNNGVAVINPQTAANLLKLDINAVLSAGSDHSSYLVGTSGPLGQRQVTVVKIGGNGSLDGSFGQGGVSLAQAPAGAVDAARTATVLSDGRILVAGNTRRGDASAALALAFTAQGGLDPAFASGGRFERSADAPREGFSTITQTSTGSIYLAGLAAPGNTGSNLLTLRVTAAGALDAKFGSGGVVTTTLSEPYAAAASVVVTADGGALVSARTGTTETSLGTNSVGVSIARYTAAGAPFTSFGANGIVVLSTSTSSNAAPAATAMAIVPLDDGTVVIGPPAELNEGDTDFETYADSSAGELQDVGGGKVRIIATETTDDSSTTLTATQIVTDGVDFSITTGASVSGAALSGKGSKIAVTLSNAGTLSASGKATYTVRLLSDLDDTTGITAVTKAINVKLAPGASKAASLAFKWPAASLAAYFLVVDVSAPTGVTDIDSSDDRAAAVGDIRVGPAFTDLTFKVVSFSDSAVQVQVVNTGNTNASGNAAVELLSLDGTELGTGVLKAKPKANGSVVATFAPSLMSAVSDESIRLDFSGDLVKLDTDTDDNFAMT